MAAKGNLFVISGPAGVGKGTIVKMVEAALEDAWVSISATTRAPRGTEQDGVEYFFYDDERFDRTIEQDGFIEWANVHSARYGTPRAAVEEQLAAGRQVLLEIDVQGGFQIKEQYPESHLVFIEPPDMDVLLERLSGRGTDDACEIARRMKTAEVELSQKMKYDIAIVNDDLDTAVAELLAYIESCAT